jgi:hypothetical protein
MRLLLVEDDEQLARQLTAALGEAGFAVDTVNDGTEAEFRGQTEDYDAIVLFDVPHFGVSCAGECIDDGIGGIECVREDDRRCCKEQRNYEGSLHDNSPFGVCRWGTSARRRPVSTARVTRR